VFAKTFRDAVSLERECAAPLMAIVPAGCFKMGSPPKESGRYERESPQHKVCIAARFAMGVYPVTFEEYDCFADNTRRRRPRDEGWGRGNRPVINVSWNDAQAYCVWLSEQTGQRYRLPSEAEWEYACRAGTDTPFHFGVGLTTKQANFDGRDTDNGSDNRRYRGKTLPVGSLIPNAFDLYDMHGNVWEWCQDGWHDDYMGAPSDGSSWEERSRLSWIFGSCVLGARVLRGGSWEDSAWNCRAAARSFDDPDLRYHNIGFRVCRSVHIK